jgi:ketosteroid isomerase-like protein
MQESLDPLAAEREFFGALVQADLETLDRILAEDFLLIDVMSGSEITKAMFLAVLESGQITFDAIEPADVRVRLYPPAAIVTGRTLMRGRFGETPFTLGSRYTHVYVEQQGRWRLVTAQGTQIAPQAG